MSLLTYVFCVVRAGRRPSIPRLPRAATLPGSTNARALPAGEGLWLIVASVPEKDYNEAALLTGLQHLEWVSRRAMAHETMVEHYLSAAAVLPMQLFTLFTSDERALHHVGRQRKEIVRILKRVERKVEWGVRLTFDETAARKSVEGGSRRVSGVQPTGASYLARKRDLLDASRGQLQKARADASRLFGALTKVAVDSRRRTETEQASPKARLLLDAAFLVPRTRARTFQAAVRRQAATLEGAGIVLSLTGPWPPYNFISSSPASTRGKG